MGFLPSRLAPALCALGVFAFSHIGAAQEKAAANAPGPSLALEAYLQQVREGNGNFVSSSLRLEGAELRKEEAEVLTEPSLIGTVDHADDSRDTGSAFAGTQRRSEAYSLGVKQVTDFGLEAKLTYTHNYTKIQGIDPNFISAIQPLYYTSGPLLELTQSLLKNGFGGETRANQDKIDADIQKIRFDEAFKQKQLMSDAESAYWGLALAREAVARTQETVDRAQRLRGIQQQRERNNLGNRSDFLQSDAAFLERSLELRTALDQERAASREFNTIRGVDSDVTDEKLVAFDGDFLKTLSAPVRKQPREDVLAADQNRRSVAATAELGAQKNRPTLNVVGSVGLNGRDIEGNASIDESFGTKHTYYTVGLRLDMPLDMIAQHDTRAGYRKQVLAAEHEYSRKAFEEDRLWKNSLALFTEEQERLKLALAIEKAQREKLNFERSRQTRGLATIFQVLQFEQDFANAQLARIRAQANILTTYATLKTFGSAK